MRPGREWDGGSEREKISSSILTGEPHSRVVSTFFIVFNFFFYKIIISLSFLFFLIKLFWKKSRLFSCLFRFSFSSIMISLLFLRVSLPRESGCAPPGEIKKDLLIPSPRTLNNEFAGLVNVNSLQSEKVIFLINLKPLDSLVGSCCHCLGRWFHFSFFFHLFLGYRIKKLELLRLEVK